MVLCLSASSDGNLVWTYTRDYSQNVGHSTDILIILFTACAAGSLRGVGRMSNDPAWLLE